MSKDILNILMSSVNDSLGLISKLIDTCPEEVWNEKAGNWPVWQHIAHVASGTDFFTPGPDAPVPAPLTSDITRLTAVGDIKVEKKVLSDYLKAGREKLSTFAESLSDRDLTQINPKCQAIGFDWSLAKTLTVLSGHAIYHLGGADAVLRAKGFPGIF
jgi:hypothetical protein